MNWAIDVSSYDAATTVARQTVWKPVDWAKTDLSLAIIKCSESVREDPAFRIQWAAAKGILPRMAYHFFRSNMNAIAQADKVKSILEDDFDPKIDFVAVDFETTDGVPGLQRLNALGSWLYEIEKLGITPLIYTYRFFWLDAGGATAIWAAKYPLWFAAWPRDNWIANLPLPPYTFTADKFAVFKTDIVTEKYKPFVPPPWEKCAVWQFTARADTKAVPGHPAVKKACDYNAVYMPLPSMISLPIPVLTVEQRLRRLEKIHSLA